MFEIRFSTGAVGDLKKIRVHDRTRVLDELEGQLSGQPKVLSRNRKILVDLVPPFEVHPPVWELRIGDYRVFYDVDQEQQQVHIRAIRRKPPHATTEEIL